MATEGLEDELLAGERNPPTSVHALKKANLRSFA